MAKVLVTNECRLTDPHLWAVEVDESDLDNFESGMHVQKAFPYLTAEEREFFITGFCPDCWDKVFAEEM